MYRSSLTLAFVVLYSAAGAASDLSSVYVAPGGITRLPQTSMCVRDRPIGNGLTRNPVTDIGSPLTGRRDRIPCTGIGLWRVRTGLRRAAGLCRPHARLSRALLRSERYYGRSATPRRNTIMEYAPRPPLPVPYRSAGTMRRRLRRVGVLRLKPRALRAGVRCRRWRQLDKRREDGWSAAIPIAPVWYGIRPVAPRRDPLSISTAKMMGFAESTTSGRPKAWTRWLYPSCEL